MSRKIIPRVRTQKQSHRYRLYQQRITSGYIILLLTAFLFYFDGNGYQRIMAAKYAAFCLLSGGYLISMVVVTLDQIVIGALSPSSPAELWRRAAWPQRLILIYIAVTWLSALCSPYWPETVTGVTRYEGALTITLYGLCFLLVSMFGRPDRKLLWVLGGSATLFSLLCLIQMAGYNPFGLYPAGYTYADAYTGYAGAYLGTIGNVDLVAAFLSLTIPLLAFSVIRLPGGLRFLLLIPLGLSLAVLVKMSVLAGYVGAGLGCLTAVPVTGSRNPKRRKWLAAALLGLAAAGLAAVWTVDLGGELFHQLHLLLRGRADPSFGSGRLHIWREVLQKVPDRLLLGAGPDTMAYGGLEPFRRYDAQLGLDLVGRIDTAHNEYLNVLYHQGLPALLAYGGALGLLAAGWVRRSPEDNGTAILGAGLCGYCVQAFFGISCCVTAPFFWAALGLLAAKPEKMGETEKKSEKYQKISKK